MHLTGIMKSNYTMLDNLQLGIKPTKEGMQEVIDAVNKWNKANGRATKYQINNLADCQSALVDYIKMQGLAGYAANEAAGTIQGSWAALKGSWQNLLVGFADGNQDLNVLIQNVVDNATIVWQNLKLRIKQVLDNIVSLLPDWAQNAIEKISVLVNFLQENVPKAIDYIKVKLNELKQFYEKHKTLIDTLIIVLGSFATSFLLVGSVIMITSKILTGLSVAFAILTSPIGWVILAIGALIAIGVLLYKNWDKIKAKATEIFTGIRDFIIRKNRRSKRKV